MLGIPYIAEVCTAVLQESKTMQGRFFVCPEFLTEINSGSLEQVVTAATGTEGYKNFPAAFMVPPVITGDLASADAQRVLYPISLAFLTTTYYDSNNNVKQESAYTGQSTHTVVQDWHDMQRCAMEFLRMANAMIQEKGISGLIYISQREPHQIQMISKVGTARLSGVLLNFVVSVFTSCDQAEEDYPADAGERINFTNTDSHPWHAQ